MQIHEKHRITGRALSSLLTQLAPQHFKLGYNDLPGKINPALALTTFRITTKDRPKVDPLTIQDAELIIAAAHRLHGQWYGNYEEFRFFTGLRQSEQFALEVDDCDLVNGKISVTKAVVETRSKNRTKTNQDRDITLCPRALEVLRTQFALRERMVADRQINHNFVFFSAVANRWKRPSCLTTAGLRCWRLFQSGIANHTTLGIHIRAGG